MMNTTSISQTKIKSEVRARTHQVHVVTCACLHRKQEDSYSEELGSIKNNSASKNRIEIANNMKNKK